MKAISLLKYVSKLTGSQNLVNEILMKSYLYLISL